MKAVIDTACCAAAAKCNGANQSAAGTTVTSRSFAAGLRPTTAGFSAGCVNNPGDATAGTVPGSGTEQLTPLSFRGAPDFGARFRNRRKVVEPFERSAGVDNRARAMTLLGFRNNRIQRAAPTSPDHLDIDLRIGARRH